MIRDTLFKKILKNKSGLPYLSLPLNVYCNTTYTCIMIDLGNFVFDTEEGLIPESKKLKNECIYIKGSHNDTVTEDNIIHNYKYKH